MGAMNPKKVRSIKKRDGDEPTKLFKKGGKVRKFSEGREVESEDRAEPKKRNYDREPPKREARLSFMGGGGKDKSAIAAGGRLSYEIPAGKNATISPYLEGFVAKPKGRELFGRLTGAGVTYQKQFKKGGTTTKSKVNEAGNYTKPGMRKALFERIKSQAVQGTAAGQWSARKAQLLAKQYKAKGGGYKG
jgi:hypothetical protein